MPKGVSSYSQISIKMSGFFIFMPAHFIRYLPN